MEKSKDVLLILDKAKKQAIDLKRPYVCLDLLWDSLIFHHSISVGKILESLNLDIELAAILSHGFVTDKKESKKPSSNYNKDVRQILIIAEHLAEQLEEEDISVEILLLSLVSYPKHGRFLKLILESEGLEIKDFIEEIILFIKDLASPNSFNAAILEEEREEEEATDKSFHEDDSNEVLESFSVNLNKKAKQGEYDGLVDFGERLKKVEVVLSRKKKPNPILVGPAGCGKTAIVELLAREIVNSRVPDCLKNKVIFEVSLADMVSGTEFRGNFEERIKEFINEVMKYDNIILFFDEIHTLIGAGGTGRKGDLEASNILKPYLARGEISCIGATTDYEYNQKFKKDPALDRRFERISVLSLSSTQMLEIADEIVEGFSENSEIVYFDHFSKSAVKMCDTFMPNRKYPDKFVDVVDQAGAFARVEDSNEVTPEILNKVFADKGGLFLKDFSVDLLKEFGNAKIKEGGIVGSLKKISEEMKFGVSKNTPSSIFTFGEEKDVKTAVCVFENYFKRASIPYYSLSAKSLADRVSISGFSEDYICSLAQKASILEGVVFLIRDLDKISKEAQDSLIEILQEGKATLSNGEEVFFGNSLFLFFGLKTSVGTLGFEKRQENLSDLNKDFKKVINNQFLVEKV